MNHVLYFLLPVLLWSSPALAQADASAVKPDAVSVPDAPSSAAAATPADVSKPADVTVVVTDVTVGPAAAPTVEPPKPPPKDIGEAVGGLISAIQGGQWTLVVAFVLMLLIWVVRLLWSAFPVKWTPWIASIAGILGAVATALATGEGIGAAIIGGLTVALSANGLWGLVGKHVLPKGKNA